MACTEGQLLPKCGKCCISAQITQRPLLLFPFTCLLHFRIHEAKDKTAEEAKKCPFALFFNHWELVCVGNRSNREILRWNVFSWTIKGTENFGRLNIFDIEGETLLGFICRTKNPPHLTWCNTVTLFHLQLKDASQPHEAHLLTSHKIRTCSAGIIMIH